MVIQKEHMLHILKEGNPIKETVFTFVCNSQQQRTLLRLIVNMSVCAGMHE